MIKKLKLLSSSVIVVYILNSGFAFGMMRDDERQNERLSSARSEKSTMRFTKTVIPEIALGHEAIYERFLRGKLIYKPNKENDIGKIELLIADLTNPLDGEFDLSGCGDAGKYLRISTGYRKEKKNEHRNKVEIWFAPHFLIEKNINGSASHFKKIMGTWDAQSAPVGMFLNWGGWDDLDAYDLTTKLSWDQYNEDKNNLHSIAPRPFWSYVYDLPLASATSSVSRSSLFHIIFEE